MSEQRGLRNPDTHGTTSDGEPYCESCGVCDEGWRCRCCLAAEVEALRARNETLIATIQRQDSTFERQMEEHEELEALRGENKALKYMVERDTAAIQRVRGACEDGNARTVWGGDGQVWTVVDRDAVLNALDGDNDA